MLTLRSFWMAVGHRLRRSSRCNGTLVWSGSARAFPRFSFAFHLLHSGSRVLRFRLFCWRRSGLPDCIMTTSWIWRGLPYDCDHHHVLGTRIWDRREMASLFHHRTFWWRRRRIGVYPVCFPGCAMCLQYIFESHRATLGRVHMEISGSCKSADRVHLEGILQRWFAAQGVSEEGATRAVRLLDASTLLVQPRPSRWNRRGAFGIQERCRYLWYRHAARILGWCDRRRFPDIVTGILRDHVFPSEAGRDEATREDGKGRVPAIAHAGPPHIDTDPSDAG